MEIGNKSDFNTITNALLSLWEQKNSLFIRQQIEKESGESYESVREKIIKWSGVTPEELITFLDPGQIKKNIVQTTKDIKNGYTAIPNLQIEKMSPEELADGGKALNIHYNFSDTLFGRIIIASTKKGVCFLAFSGKEDKEAMATLQQRFPNAAYHHTSDEFQSNALWLFGYKTGQMPSINLHVKGTPFQIKIWEKLLQIPSGGLMSYGALADNPKYSHALGAAVGANPVAFIIPCHRAVPASGKFGEYHWGSGRKAAIISWEVAQRGKIS